MRERWAEEITKRAAAVWTPQRQRAAFGERELLLPVIESAPLLRVLGLLDRHGDMGPDAIRKTTQINHMVGLLRPVFLDLTEQHPVVRVLDVACGSSYLTLLLAWCFEHRWHHPCRILGVDRNPAVVARSRERAADALLAHRLRFEASTIGAFETSATWSAAFGEAIEPGDVHAVVALHACDTATDEALALGVTLAAEFIGVAPCCQAELARAWAQLAEQGRPGPFAPLWSSNHLRREAGATLTDALRTLLLRAHGYRVTAMEFVSSSHTPKNTLLRARRGGGDREQAELEYRDLKAALGGVTLELERLLGSV
jgi:SAM-dependent methyltransferase